MGEDGLAATGIDGRADCRGRVHGIMQQTLHREFTDNACSDGAGMNTKGDRWMDEWMDG